MLTAYDQYAAEIFDEAGIPVLLVGDSAGNNVLRLRDDDPGDRRRAAAARAGRDPRAPGAPSSSPTCRSAPTRPAPSRRWPPATRFMKEGLAPRGQARGRRGTMAPSVELLIRAGIPVMAHVGFTPQSEHALGGYRVQGRGDAADHAGRGRRRAASRPARSRSSWRWSPRPWPREVTKALRDPHHRHRRRPGLRRPGARLAGHGRAARRHLAAVRQAVRRPAHHPRRRGPGLRRGRRGRHVPRRRSTPSSPEPGRGAAGDGHACVACSLSSPSVRPPLFSRGEPRHRAS